MTRGQDIQLVPTHPSNKNVLDQCLLWGWTIRAHTSDWVELEHRDRAERIKVRPATFRQGNGGDVLHRAYKITCNGDAVRFWTRQEPYHTSKTRQPAGSAQMSDEEMEAFAARKRAESPLDRLDRAAGLRVVPDLPDGGRADDEPPASMPEPESPQPSRQTVRSMRDSSYSRGSEPRPRTIEHDVLRVARALASANPVIQLDAVLSLIPDLTRQQVVNTMTRLADRGLIEYGHGKGKYVLAAPPKTPEPAAPIAAPSEAPSSLAPAAAAPTSPHGDTVDAVMDLMFPDGVKTKHMPALIRWREETIRMMTEVLDGP